ncbi:MAG: fused MFS/spermidine synthase, partial [Anaerolineae bacterium]
MAAELGRDRLLAVLVFTSGFGILALEMSAARLLAPFFGTSLVIWANLIGLVMVALAAGYLLGGRWADRNPRRKVPYQIVAWAGFYSGLIPLLARPILNISATGFQQLAADILLGSLVALLALFAVPVVLLACVGPFAIRLQASSVDTTGQTAGGIYALSTAGSLVGTFLPVLVTIPALGTRVTFLLISLVLLAVSLAGLFQRVGRRAWVYVSLPVIVVGLAFLTGAGPVKAPQS